MPGTQDQILGAFAFAPTSTGALPAVHHHPCNEPQRSRIAAGCELRDAFGQQISRRQMVDVAKTEVPTRRQGRYGSVTWQSPPRPSASPSRFRRSAAPTRRSN